jgi:2-phosphosulfolactate phosphatase
MEIRLASLIEGARTAEGIVVIIDVFRAFSAAAVALARGARRVIMVDSLDQALALRAAGTGELCMGERRGARPEGFDFGNSPAELAAADLGGKTLIQTTTNGTAGLHAAARAERLYAGALVSAEATVQAILRQRPGLVTLVAMGREGRHRADEDELCALYLRARLQGRQPDTVAVRALLASMPPPPNAALVASGAYDPRDRDVAAEIDRVAFAVRVRQEAGLLIATAEAVSPG